MSWSHHELLFPLQSLLKLPALLPEVFLHVSQHFLLVQSVHPIFLPQSLVLVSQLHELVPLLALHVVHFVACLDPLCLDLCLYFARQFSLALNPQFVDCLLSKLTSSVHSFDDFFLVAALLDHVFP